MIDFNGVVIEANDSDTYPTLFENRVIVGHNILSLDGLVADVQNHLERLRTVIITGKSWVGKLVYNLSDHEIIRICHYKKHDDLHAICTLHADENSIRRCDKCNAQNAIKQM